MDLIPPSDRVICRQLPAETRTAFGLEIPEVAQEAPLRAVVLAVGEGTPHPQPVYPEQMIPLGAHHHRVNDQLEVLSVLAPGDEVVLPRYGGSEIVSEDGETLISILASDILAVVS